jgi:hypothetical protein
MSSPYSTTAKKRFLTAGFGFARPDGSIIKRVRKACDRCRLRKVRCDGSNPCVRCRADNANCVFGYVYSPPIQYHSPVQMADRLKEEEQDQTRQEVSERLRGSP